MAIAYSFKKRIFSRPGLLTIISIIAISTLLPLLSHIKSLSAASDLDNLSVKIVRVNDGDTVTIFANGKKERVRLIGIDAPELGQRPWGRRASRHLKEIIDGSGNTVTVELDVEKRDKYGRVLAYLWTDDRELINLRMIEDGYAVLFTIPPNVRHADEFREGQRKARQEGLGIWGKNGLRERPWKYRREHPF